MLAAPGTPPDGPAEIDAEIDLRYNVLGSLGAARLEAIGVSNCGTDNTDEAHGDNIHQEFPAHCLNIGGG